MEDREIIALFQERSQQAILSLQDHQEAITTELSEEELARVIKVIRDYYVNVSVQAGDPVQIASNYRNRSYKGYDVNEIAVFQMWGGETIIVGSKDGWASCTVLNEGY